ncbi:MAG: hypothetical protein DME04_14515 [Candidatus Rokuibacteriota bacterium]|nr:MAG: hypothetical protein DME04_14515 [Candidatus Rokubacteria bacterium]
MRVTLCGMRVPVNPSARIEDVIALALVLVALGAGDHDRSLAVGGAPRTYIVRVPPRVSEGAPPGTPLDGH